MHVIIKIKLFTKNRLGKTQSVVVIYLQQSLYFGGVFFYITKLDCLNTPVHERGEKICVHLKI